MFVFFVGLIIFFLNLLVVDFFCKIEQYYEVILVLWNQFYINMKSLVFWYYCMIDIEKIRVMIIVKLKIMWQEDYMKMIVDFELYY